MKTWIRHSITTFIVAATCTATGILRQLSNAEDERLCCRQISVRIIGDGQFLSPDDVCAYLNSNYGNFIGQSREKLKLYEIEKTLSSHWFVKSSQAWLTQDGILHVDVFQKKPLMRFILGDGGFYVDAEGEEFPLCSTYSAPVPEVFGKLQNKEWILSTLSLAERKDIERIDVDNAGNIVIHTSAGPEAFLFGQPVRIAEKLKLIDVYFNRIVPARGAASCVDVKCSGRIVCKI